MGTEVDYVQIEVVCHPSLRIVFAQAYVVQRYPNVFRARICLYANGSLARRAWFGSFVTGVRIRAVDGIEGVAACVDSVFVNGFAVAVWVCVFSVAHLERRAVNSMVANVGVLLDRRAVETVSVRDASYVAGLFGP